MGYTPSSRSSEGLFKLVFLKLLATMVESLDYMWDSEASSSYKITYYLEDKSMEVEE